MGDSQNLDERIDKLAREILLVSRNSLMVNLRFLDVALSRVKYKPLESTTIAIDGKFLLYNPKFLLSSYKKEKEYVTRAYLHMLLHCVFRHMFGTANLKPEYWDLACDIAVEATIIDLNLNIAIVKREYEKKITTISELKTEIGNLTAEKIYHYFLFNKVDESKLEELSKLFCVDDHLFWYIKSEKGGSSANGSSSESGYSESELLKQEADWKKISERMQVELETFYKRKGTVSGNMLQNLKEINRERYNYEEFLKKFAVRSEVMKVNDDEFDYIFYTYGMELYGNVPLIEPLEYKDEKRIKEFVIAIDTSGSVMGDEVQAFVQKTYNILKSTESFESKINLHIIQCDADIQEHVKITNQDEFDEWIKNLKLKGFGGTDFRPVFDKVNELIDQHEFSNLKGLIYFTDGYGTFPKKKPKYDTAFVFVSDDYELPQVPPWAIRLVLQKDEIEKFKIK